MKNLNIRVPAIALIAFSLGYFARGAVERAVNISTDPGQLTVREQTESPAADAQTTIGADQNDADAPFVESSMQAVVIEDDRTSSRKHYKKIRLGDFFLINDISPERGEQIIQDLVDADSHLKLKRNEMIDRHVAEKTGSITQEDIAKIRLTKEEEAELYSEQDSLYRQIIDEHYDAYQEYNRTYTQRQVVGAFSSGLQEPLEASAKESLVQIMHEEAARLESDLRNKAAESSAGLAGSPQEEGWEAEKKKHNERLVGMRSYKEKVLDRAEPYLTPSQFDELKRRLNNDLRRVQLLIELTDIDEGN